VGAAQISDFEHCFDRLFDHFAGAGAWRCAPGAAAALGALRERGLRTGMVSNFDHRLRPLLSELGLAPLLEVVVLPADAGVAKPDAGIFAVALTRLGVRAEQAVYIGDDAEDDLDGAQSAGLRAIDVRTLRDLRDLASQIGLRFSPPRPPRLPR
jgi:putative hydrolase of the HAD superfamily